MHVSSKPTLAGRSKGKEREEDGRKETRAHKSGQLRPFVPSSLCPQHPDLDPHQAQQPYQPRYTPSESKFSPVSMDESLPERLESWFRGRSSSEVEEEEDERSSHECEDGSNAEDQEGDL